MTRLDMSLKIARQVGVDQFVAVRIVQATLDAVIAVLATEAAWKSATSASSRCVSPT